VPPVVAHRLEQAAHRLDQARARQAELDERLRILGERVHGAEATIGRLQAERAQVVAKEPPRRSSPDRRRSRRGRW
jgi:hypothetical protein